MADRTVRVVLTADASQFDRTLKSAAGSAKSLKTELETAHKSGALRELAGQAAGFGAAWTAANAVVAKTGIEYNTLQQTSRAALTTILGGAREANAQMDKLDEFARTSPFSKSVFITAQQQMLAFGIEAEKVVPYLSAINDAVAAAGGNNQTVAELASIMGKISSTSKITAEDLNMFGERGLNAAQIIGDAMGKTAGQIRDEITAGTLDADVALDALASGMSEKFAGASAAVKDTMAGAFDSVKAAFRDLSADIMAGAVDPEGGGWLVDLTNQAADLLRAFQRLPGPIKEGVGAISGIGGAALLAVGGVTKLVDISLSMRDTWGQLATDMPRLASGLGNVGKAAGIAAAAFAALTIVAQIGQALDGLTTGADNAEAALARLSKGTGDLDSVFQRIGGQDLFTGIGQQVNDLDSALERFSERGIRHMDWLDGFMSSITGTDSALGLLKQQFGQLDAQMAQMSPEDAAEAFTHIAERAEAVGLPVADLIELFPQYAEQIQLLAAQQGLAELSAQDLTDAMQGLNPSLVAAQEAASAAVQPTRDYAAEAEAAAQAAADLASAVDETRQSLNDYYSAALAMSDATIAAEAAFQKATDAAKENGATLDLTTEKGRENQKALNDVATAAERQAIAMLEAEESTAAVAAASSRAREQFVTVAIQMGMNSDEAEALADRYGLIPEDVTTRLSQPGMEGSQQEAQAYRELLARLPEEVRTHIRTIPDLSGYYDVDRALNRINGRTVTTYVEMKQYGQGKLADGGRVGDALAVYGMTDGGRVYGSGTSTSDTAANVALSNDEYVVRAWAARMIGYDRLDYMNATGRLPQAQEMQRTPSQYTVNYSIPQQAQAPTNARLSRDDVELLARTIVTMAQGVSARTLDSAVLTAQRGL